MSKLCNVPDNHKPGAAELPGTGDAAEPEGQAVDTRFDPDLLTAADPKAAEAPDPFDPDSLRLPEDSVLTLGVKKQLLTVKVRKPDKSWFVRVHPDPRYRLQTAVIELKEDREVYLIAPSLWADLATEPTYKRKMVATAITRQGDTFLWEMNMPAAGGRADEWANTGLAAIDRATKHWVRVVPNMTAGGYELYQATGNLGDPEWPEITFRELIRLAFKDRFIDCLDHPILRRLRGEV